MEAEIVGAVGATVLTYLTYVYVLRKVMPSYTKELDKLIQKVIFKIRRGFR